MESTAVDISHWLGPVLATCARNLGGTWADQPVRDTLAHYTPYDDTYYRAHYAYLARTIGVGEARTFEEARPGYVLGHLAGLHSERGPEAWNEVEAELQQAWSAGDCGDWPSVNRFARAAYRRTASAEQRAWRARHADANRSGPHLLD